MAEFDLDAQLARWNREAIKDELAETEKQRRHVEERFPLSDWPSMALQRYALGLDTTDTFCWWLEFGTPLVGSIRGGSARKLLIYKKRGEPGWYHDPQYENEDAAWSAIRAGFVRAFELADEGRFDEIDDIPALYGGPALRVKATYIYYPEDLLPICSKGHLDHFLALFGESQPGSDSIRANRRLLAVLRDQPELSDFSTKELERFLYLAAPPHMSRRIVKIAPGHDAVYWSECLDGGYICVGWDDVGDLTQFPSKETFRASFAGAYPYNGNAAQVSRKANELWTLRELQPGDLVIANKGTAEVLGIGTVTDEGYRWREDREKYRHTVTVDWDTSCAGPLDPPVKAWATTTVKPVPLTLYQQITGSNAGTDGGSTADADVVQDELLLRLDDVLRRKKQVILYGPPGTGKTYHARRFAAWWLAGGTSDAESWKALRSRDSVEQTLDAYSSPGTGDRVWFMVANPERWSWKQMFEEGGVDYAYGQLKRNFRDAQAGDLVVGYQTAPDKRVVALARVVNDFVTEENADESKLWLAPVLAVRNGPTWDDLAGHPLLSNSEPVKMNANGSMFRLTDEEATALLTLVAERDQRVDPTRVRENDLTGWFTQVTFHPSYTYEDFVEGYRPIPSADNTLQLALRDGIFKRLCGTAAADPDNDYLLLIDEINRGNVPRIFGELITLLEADKRNVAVTLPQSGDQFFVPENVHVIGTMNTADRSIHLLDVALRRRFAFVELLPDADVLAGAAIGPLSLDVFLSELNSRVMARAGRERQVGHAVLIGADGQPITTPTEFALAFRHEILPLLQEYVYEDYRDLARILGTDVIDEEAQVPRWDVVDDPEALVAALAQEFDTKPDPNE